MKIRTIWKLNALFAQHVVPVRCAAHVFFDDVRRVSKNMKASSGRVGCWWTGHGFQDWGVVFLLTGAWLSLALHGPKDESLTLPTTVWWVWQYVFMMSCFHNISAVFSWIFDYFRTVRKFGNGLPFLAEPICRAVFFSFVSQHLETEAGSKWWLNRDTFRNSQNAQPTVIFSKTVYIFWHCNHLKTVKDVLKGYRRILYEDWSADELRCFPFLWRQHGSMGCATRVQSIESISFDQATCRVRNSKLHLEVLTRMVVHIREHSSRDGGGKCSRQARMKSEGDGPQVKDSPVPRDEYHAAFLQKFTSSRVQWEIIC